MKERYPHIYLVRHGETEWSQNGRHTGSTDISLTKRGEENARMAGRRLSRLNFSLVLTSPLKRAKETCEIAGFGGTAKVCDDLVEWRYGAYEGRKTIDIHREDPDWNVFYDGCPEGEMPEDIGRRADRVIKKIRETDGDLLIFSHGHFLRVLAARWLNLTAEHGQRFYLSTATLSILGYEHGLNRPVIFLWNDGSHLTKN